MTAHGSPVGKAIGEGSFGRIYATDKRYAVKIIPRGSLFRSSAELHTTDLNGLVYPLTLRHPAIVRCYNAYIGDKDISSVMDLYKNNIFCSSIFENPPVFRRLCSQMVSAVAYLTARGILHGDIKPQNILYRRAEDRTYTFALADFDLTQNQLCRSNQVEGYNLYTVNYRPPELLVPIGYVNQQADVWALGAALASAYHQDTFFQGQDENDVRAIIPKFIPIKATGLGRSWSVFLGKDLSGSLPESKLALNPRVDSFLRRMLQLDPKDRVDIFELQHDDFLSIPDKIPANTCLDRVEYFDRRIDWSPLAHDKLSCADKWDILTTWMLEVGREIDYGATTSIMAIELLARYCLTKSRPEFGKVQLLACATMYLAGLFGGYDMFSSEMAAFSDNAYTSAQVVEMAIDVLGTLNYDLCAKTGYDDIYRYRNTFGCSSIDTAVSLLQLAYTQLDLFSNPNTPRIALYISVLAADENEDVWADPIPDGVEEWKTLMITYFKDHQGPFRQDILDLGSDVIQGL